jgi:hypothetical protein
LRLLLALQTVSGPFGPYFIKNRSKYPLRSIEMAYNNYKTVRKAVRTPKNDKNGLLMSEKKLRE